MNVVIRRCEVGGRVVDALVEGGTLTAIGPSVAVPRDAATLDAEGGALIPGLHDHHLHLLALAAAQASVPVGPPDVDDRRRFERALRAAALDAPPGRWVRAVGYSETVAGPLDREALDAVVPATPVRVQHRSGALWVLNSAALRALGCDHGAADLPAGAERGPDGTPTGRLFRADAWLRDRLGPVAFPDLTAVGRRLLRRGVTAVTDATPFATAPPLLALAAGRRSGALPQDITVMGAPGLDPAAVPDGLHLGPAKILMPDHEPPLLDELVDMVRTARAADRTVAFHCVTRVAAVLAVAALDTVGARSGDRIEHGAVLPPEQRDDIVRLGLTVVTQPNLVAERGDDYLADVDGDDLPHLWPCGSLLRAGVAVAGGTDAPFGDPDPWRLIDAAVTRRTRAGRVLGPGDRLPGRRALDLLLGPAGAPARPRRLATGSRADLCLLGDPLDVVLAHPARALVRSVVVGPDVHALDAVLM